MPGITDVLSYNTQNTRASSATKSKGSTTTAGSNLSMADFYKLMAAQLRYQDADNPMDTSAMMSQMVQAQMIQTMVQMNQVSVTTYAASLVGKEVTMGELNASGFTGETKVGTVTGVSMFEGEPTIFVDGKGYYMSQLLYVGKGPAAKPEEDGDKDEDKTEEPDGSNGADGPNGPDGSNGADGPNGPDGSNGAGDAGDNGNGDTGNSGGTNGTPDPGSNGGTNGTPEPGNNGTGDSGSSGTDGAAGTGGTDSGSGQQEAPGTETGTETGSDASGYSI